MLINNNLNIPSIEDMICRGTTPDYIKKIIDKIKTILLKDENVYQLLVKNNLIQSNERESNNPLEIKYHGSYARHTEAFYFNKIDKSDIDIYVKVGSYHSSPSIFKNRDGNDKDFLKFSKQWNTGIANSFHISKDSGGQSYKDIIYFSNFKNDLSSYLETKLNDCIIENTNKVIRINKGLLTIEIAICGEFNLELNNNAKGQTWIKEIFEYYQNKKTDVNNYIQTHNNFFDIKGINLITSNSEEIQNFPEINNINIIIKNNNTGGLFSKYARYLKNLVKLINDNQGLIIPIKSYHLECLLYSVENKNFKSLNSKQEMKNNLLNLLQNMSSHKEEDFKKIKEINCVLKLQRNLKYEDYKNSFRNLETFIKCKL